MRKGQDQIERLKKEDFESYTSEEIQRLDWALVKAGHGWRTRRKHY